MRERKLKFYAYKLNNKLTQCPNTCIPLLTDYNDIALKELCELKSYIEEKFPELKNARLIVLEENECQ